MHGDKSGKVLGTCRGLDQTSVMVTQISVTTNPEVTNLCPSGIPVHMWKKWLLHWDEGISNIAPPIVAMVPKVSRSQADSWPLDSFPTGESRTLDREGVNVAGLSHPVASIAVTAL